MNLSLICTDSTVQVSCTLQPLELELRALFGTSHSQTTQRQNALFQLSLTVKEVCITGYGEVGLPPKKPGCYVADFADVNRHFCSWTQRLKDANLRVQPSIVKKSRPGKEEWFSYAPNSDTAAVVEALSFLLTGWEEYEQTLSADSLTSVPPARNGVEMAILDAWGRACRVSLYDVVSDRVGRTRPSCKDDHKLSSDEKDSPCPHCHTSHSCPRSFYTAALQADLNDIRDSARFGQTNTPLLKIKLDANIANNEKILDMLAQESQPTTMWSIDANASWSPDLALDHLKVLSKYKHMVYMVEQPFPLWRANANDRGLVQYAHDGSTAEVPQSVQAQWMDVKAEYTRAGIPIYADESICTEHDVRAMQPFAHGVNVKLDKAGGITRALDAIRAAYDNGMRVWIGIMVCSSLGCAAALTLLPLATCCVGDIDGGLLVTPASDPFRDAIQWDANSGAVRLAASHPHGLRLTRTPPLAAPES